MGRKLSPIVFVSMVVFGVTSFGALTPSEEPVTVLKNYSAVGFDDNDKVEITVSGELPSGCFRTAETKWNREGDKIVVEQMAYKYGGVCLNIPMPFSQTVKLGIVPEGNYTVVDKGSKQAVGTLVIGPATRVEADDFDYAQVSDAYVTADESNGKTLVVKVKVPNKGIKVDAAVKYYSDSIVVRPITEKISCDNCEGVTKKTVILRKALPSGLRGTFLLHVRSAEGDAVSKLVELE